MKALFIDVGMTLLGGPEKSPATYIQEVLNFKNKSTISNIVFTRNITDVDELLDILSDELMIRLSIGEANRIRIYWNEQLSQCYPIDGVIEFCNNIIHLGIPYYIVSNLWHPFHQALETYLPKFVEHANGRFLSYKMNCCKPSNEFYTQVYSSVCKELKIKPQEIIMIGDSLENDILPCSKRGSINILLSVIKNNYRSQLKGTIENLYEAKNYNRCLKIINRLTKGDKLA